MRVIGTTDRARGLAHLAIVYLVWGSTFLAIRVGVRGDDGFGPFSLSALRVLAGGLFLAGASVVMRVPFRPPPRLVPDLLASGVLLWAVGHAALLYGAQHAGSGLAAILFGTAPLFSFVIEVLLGRRRADARSLAWLLAGFSGIVLLALPSLAAGSAPNERWASLALILAPIGWAAGSVVQGLRAGSVPALASAAWQQLFGGAACALLAAAAGEELAGVSYGAWLSFAYLVVPGCIPAFTSYVRALQLLPTTVVMSFAYVNPIIAVWLGWWILDEPLGPPVFLAMALVVSGVIGTMAGHRPLDG